MSFHRSSVVLSAPLVLLAVLVCAGCNGSFVSGNAKSELRRGEVFSVELAHVDHDSPPAWEEPNADTGEEFMGIITALAPVVIDYALRFVSAEVKREAKRYDAAYGGATADDWFYLDRTAFSDTNLSEILLTRTYYDPETRDDEIGMLLRLKVRQAADKTHFRLVPTEFKLLAAAAKLRKKDDTVDLKIDLTMDHFYREGTISKATSVSVPSIVLKNARLGTDWPSNGKPMPRALKGVSSHFFPLPPRTKREINGEEFYGLGCYAVRAVVSESDAFGDRVHDVATFLDKDETKQAVSDRVLDLLTRITGSASGSGSDAGSGQGTDAGAGGVDTSGLGIGG